VFFRLLRIHPLFGPPARAVRAPPSPKVPAASVGGPFRCAVVVIVAREVVVVVVVMFAFR
jgi:hypothetical protein